MATRCTAEQLAEVVTLFSLQAFGFPKLCVEREDAGDLKPLDLFLSTLEIFRRVYTDKFPTAFYRHKQIDLLSTENFIKHLFPRAWFLTLNTGCFDLLLTCTVVSYPISIFSANDRCFHFSRDACELLATVLGDKYCDMFNTDSGWKELMSYCRKIHDLVFPSKENRPPGYCITKDSKDDWGDSPNKGKLIDGKGPTFNEELSEVELNQQEDFKCSGEEIDATFLGKTASKMAQGKSMNPLALVESSNTKGKSMDFLAAVQSSNSESLDDNSAYWDYETMSDCTIFEKITENAQYLQIIFNILEIVQRFSLGIHDKLEYLAAINEREEYQSSNERCKLCHEKMNDFCNNWLASYRDKYLNGDLVSDFLH